jgi:hypothetical protein
MKISIFVNQDAMQFNLTPETDHEKEFLRMLNKYTGEVTIHSGVDISLNQANYLRSFGERSDAVAITIHKPESKP